MTTFTALAFMRNWIIDKIEDNNKTLLEWQVKATFVGIFFSIVAAIGLFMISKPLTISAFVLFGLSLIIPLFVQSVPFSTEHQVVLAATNKYKSAIIDTLFEMNVGISHIGFPVSVLDEDVKIRVKIGGEPAEIYLREANGEIGFFHDDKPILPNPHVHMSYGTVGIYQAPVI